MKQAMMFAAIAVVTLAVQANPPIVECDHGASQLAFNAMSLYFAGNAD